MARIILTEEEKKWVADEKFLQRELKTLRTEKNQLTAENNALIQKNSNLKQERINAEREAARIIEEAKETAKVITGRARELEQTANKKRSLVDTKISELEELKTKTNNILKSNEGKEKNLSAEKEIIAEQKAKLTRILGMIKDVI